MYGCVLIVPELHQLGIWLLLFKLKVIQVAADGSSIHLEGQETGPACRSPQRQTSSMQVTQQLSEYCAGLGVTGVTQTTSSNLQLRGATQKSNLGGSEGCLAVTQCATDWTWHHPLPCHCQDLFFHCYQPRYTQHH